MPGREFSRQATNAASCRCTTRSQNAHGTEERELLYRWHPWAGRSVHVHEVIEKAGWVAFRCSLTGIASDRRLEVPVWMFDRVGEPMLAGRDGPGCLGGGSGSSGGIAARRGRRLRWRIANARFERSIGVSRGDSGRCRCDADRHRSNSTCSPIPATPIRSRRRTGRRCPRRRG